MWVGALVVTFMVLSFSGMVEDSFAQTDFTLTYPDFITDTTSYNLDHPHQITSFTANSKTYLAVASFNDGGIQIIDVSDPDDIAARDLLNDTVSNMAELNGAFGITSFMANSKPYIAVASFGDSGVQIIDVSDPANITATDSLDDDSTLVLGGAVGITSFIANSKPYLAVAAHNDGGVQIIDVSDPANISATDSLKDADGTYELDRPYGITSFTIKSKPYIAVAAHYDDGVQIIDVSDPANISATDSITDDTTTELYGAYGITSFMVGSKTYVAVTAQPADGVQIIDVSDPANISATDSLKNDSTLELDDATGITSFMVGSKTYLAVASLEDDGVQIIDVSNPTEISGVDKVDDMDATLVLDGAYGITSFNIGSKTHLAVTAQEDDGVQIISLNRSPNANAGADKKAILDATVTLDGTRSTDPDGDTLEYTWSQTLTSETPTVPIDNYRSAQTTFTAPEDPTELVFTLTVDDGADTDTDDITITIAKPVARNIKDMDDTLVSAKITGPNEITMTYNEELSTFINSYLNFTITGESMPRNITGINGSPSIKGMANIDDVDTTVFITTLTFDGEPTPSSSTGSMYIQHADHYLAFIQVSDGQN